MQGGNGLVLDRFDGHRMKIRLEQHRCGRSCCAARTGAHHAPAAAAPRAPTVAVGGPSSARTRTPQAQPSRVAAARRTPRTDRAEAAVPRRDDLADATRQPETPILRDQQRWSYAPSGLLLALALREAELGTMMPHGRRSPFHRLQFDDVPFGIADVTPRHARRRRHGNGHDVTDRRSTVRQDLRAGGGDGVHGERDVREAWPVRESHDLCRWF